jgi:hypothetical protein
MHSAFFNTIRDPKLYQKDKRALPENLQSCKRFQFPRDDDGDDDKKWTFMPTDATISGDRNMIEKPRTF